MQSGALIIGYVCVLKKRNKVTSHLTRRSYYTCGTKSFIPFGKMTKNRCKICELLGEDHQVLNHGLSHPSHLTNLHQLNHLSPGLNYNPNPNMNYLNHGLLNGLYLPQLKDMMLAAYLLRGNEITLLIYIYVCICTYYIISISYIKRHDDMPF